MRLIFILIPVLFFMVHCGPGTTPDQDNRRAKNAPMRLGKGEAAAIAFQGTLQDIDKAVAELYRWIRSKGRMFGGAPMLVFRSFPNLSEAKRLEGTLLFPMGETDFGRTQEQGPALEVKTVPLPEGNYAAFSFRGRLQELPEALIGINKNLADKKPLPGGKTIIMFEGDFRPLNEQRRIRVLVQVAEKPAK